MPVKTSFNFNDSFSNNQNYNDYLNNLTTPKNFNCLVVDSHYGIKQTNILKFFIIKIVDFFTGQTRTSSKKLQSATVKLINFGFKNQWINQPALESIKKLSNRINPSSTSNGQSERPRTKLDNLISSLQKLLLASSSNSVQAPEETPPSLPSKNASDNLAAQSNSEPTTVSEPEPPLAPSLSTHSFKNLSAPLPSSATLPISEPTPVPVSEPETPLVSLSSDKSMQEPLALASLSDTDIELTIDQEETWSRARVITQVGISCLLGLIAYMTYRASNVSLPSNTSLSDDLPVFGPHQPMCETWGFNQTLKSNTIPGNTDPSQSFFNAFSNQQDTTFDPPTNPFSTNSQTLPTIPPDSSIMPQKLSKKPLTEYLEFTKNLNPKTPADAVLLFTGQNGKFDKVLYEKDRVRYLKKAFNQLALTIHPDKCLPEMKKACGQAILKLQQAQQVLADPQTLHPMSQAEIDENIKNLNIIQATYTSIACLFPFEKSAGGFGDINPTIDQEEMRRRISLLSNQQVGAMLNRFGYGAAVHIKDKDVLAIGNIIEYLNSEQLIYAFRQMKISQVRGFQLEHLFLDDKESCKRHLALLSNEQITDLMKRAEDRGYSSYSILKNLQPQQRKDYIQSLDFLKLRVDFILNLDKDDIHVLTQQQVKIYVEKFSHYSNVIPSLSDEQFKNYVQSIDMRIIDRNLLGRFITRKELFNILSEKQVKEGIERFGEWEMNWLKSNSERA